MLVIALLIVALAAFRPIKNWWDLRQFSNVAIDKIGAPASVCGKETTKKATGNQQHVSDGQAIFYDDVSGLRRALQHPGPHGAQALLRG